MLTKHPVVTHDKFFQHTLRSVGYNTYSALADIIDNSIEPEVGSTLVRVVPEYEGTGVKARITAIKIIDNGCGMSMEVLDEAMALGSETGKTGANNLGMYGTGLKTAAFAMGQTLEVYTRVEGSDTINYACMSLAKAIRENTSVEVELDSKPVSEMAMVAEEIGRHGTIVRISDLDHMKTYNYETFVGTAEKRFSIIFSKFFNPAEDSNSNSSTLRIMVGNRKVPYVNVAKENRFAEKWDSSECVDDAGREQVLLIDGHKIRYNVWFSPAISKADETDHMNTDEKITTSVTGEHFLPRQLNTQGFYLFRQNRLVGQALTLGVWNRHNSINGLHIELFFDGDTDYLFGAGFTKTTNDASDLKEEILSVLKQKFAPFAIQAKRRNLEKEKSTPNDQADVEFLNSVAECQNSKAALRLPFMHARNQNETEPVEHEHRGPQKNPNPVKRRNSQWLGGFEKVSLGEYGRMYLCEYSEGKTLVKINVDHSFYKEFYSKLDREMQFKMAQILSCTLNALVKSGYFSDEDVESYFENFFSEQSNAVNISLS